MPWPVTHILVAEKLYEQHFSHLDWKKFILGNCFPDIRYPAKINRKRTHFKDIPLEEIQSQSSFHAGVLFHSMVDHFWNLHVREHRQGLFLEIPHNQPMIHTMKILQDRYLYTKENGWREIAGFFDVILPEEGTFNASDEMVQRWHSLLANYLVKPPTIDDLDMLKMSLSASLVGEIRTYYRQYQENALLMDIMKDFYGAVDRLLDHVEAEAKNRPSF